MRYAFRYPVTSAGGSNVLVTSTRLPVATGGIAAPLPSKTTKSATRCERRARRPAGTFEVATAPASPPPQRRQPIVDDAGERSDLEVVGRGVTAGARERQQLVDARRRLDDLGLRRPAPAHRDDDHVAVAREQPRDVRR